MSEHKPFWMVWNMNGRTPAFKHETEDSATHEAERLANLNPGDLFVVVKAVKARIVDNMTRIDFVEDEIPF